MEYTTCECCTGLAPSVDSFKSRDLFNFLSVGLQSVILIHPVNCVLWEGYTVFTLSVRPSVIPSIRDVLVFQYLEKAIMEFHKIWQAH